MGCSGPHRLEGLRAVLNLEPCQKTGATRLRQHLLPHGARQPAALLFSAARQQKSWAGLQVYR